MCQAEIVGKMRILTFNVAILGLKAEIVRKLRVLQGRNIGSNGETCNSVFDQKKNKKKNLSQMSFKKSPTHIHFR